VVSPTSAAPGAASRPPSSGRSTTRSSGGAIHGRRRAPPRYRDGRAAVAVPRRGGTPARPERVRPQVVQRVQHRLPQLGGAADRLDDHTGVAQPVPERVDRAGVPQPDPAVAAAGGDQCAAVG
jgi:hypothetical protein